MDKSGKPFDFLRSSTGAWYANTLLEIATGPVTRLEDHRSTQAAAGMQKRVYEGEQSSRVSCLVSCKMGVDGGWVVEDSGS